MLIVYYHNVVREALDEFDRKLSRIHLDEFAGQMRRLAEDFNPVSLETMHSMLRAGEHDPKAVAVTFDDGYQGVIANALPLLRELGIPATIFVVTDYVRRPGELRLLHFDELEAAFRLTEAPSLEFEFLGKWPASLHSPHAKVDAMKRLKKRLKLLPDAEQRRLQGILLEKLGVSQEKILAYAGEQERFRTATWDELRGAADEGLEVGSHTCSHRVLSRLGRDELETEVRDSYARLREELDADFLPFAYPYGSAESIGPETPALVRKTGYSCALTTIEGKNTPALDPYLLLRVEFEALQWPW